MPLTVKGTLTCPTPEIAENVRKGMPEHIRLSREEPGNLHFNIVETRPGHWDVDEAFVDAAAFETHRARTGASEFATLAEGLERDLTIEEHS